MSIFDVLTLIGGLCLFLFGMNTMGDALERRAGNSLKKLLAKLTKNKIAGFLTGLGVTAVIQSSSATTVMVVGFVNSGLLTLRQSIGVIMGANIGTTVTAWVLSLGGISSDNVFIQLLKPTSFTPVLALIGIAFLMMGKTSKKKDTGTILLGFATLMFGMDTMSSAVSELKNVPAFQNRNTSGTFFNRSGFLRCGSTDYHGSEHRYLCDGASLILRHKQKCKARRYCPFDIQCTWYGYMAYCFQYNFCSS